MDQYPGIICHETQTGRTLWVHDGDTGVYCLTTMSSDGKLVAAGGGSESKQTVKIFDATTGTPLRQWSGFSDELLAVVLSPDGTRLATATASDGFQIWEISTGKLLKTLAYQVSRGMGAPAFSPDGRWLAVVGASTQIDQGRVGIFSVESGKLECEIRIKTDGATGFGIPLAFSSDGKFLYTGSSMLEAWLLEPTDHTENQLNMSGYPQEFGAIHQ